MTKLTLAVFVFLFIQAPAHALTLDWSGYFRADHNFVSNYQMDKSVPGYSSTGGAGESIAGQGKKNTVFSSVFLKLKPKMLVNDNVIIRSEWNVGDPVYGFFGRNVPTEDRNNPFSTGKGGMSLTVARLWLDTHTDFGTLQVGRAPMHWGLGAIFNAGDAPFDRYQSTSDTIRLVSKFGPLTIMPIYAKNSMGRNLAGARDPLADTVVQGSDDITDYGLGLKYENTEEDLDAGAMYYKRNANDSQSSYYYPQTSTYYQAGKNGMNLKLIDVYAKKTWRRLTLAGEVPYYSGDIGDVTGVGARNEYKAWALILEASLKYETWKHSLKLGRVPGQQALSVGHQVSKFGAMYLHRSYKLGQIMFGYNLGNFGGVNPDPIPSSTSTTAGNTPANAVSPYDAAITNAKYLMLSSEKRWEQWGMNFGLVFGQASEAAVSGKDSYNYRTKTWYTAVANQNTSLGFEVDVGTRYNWDESISFGGDMGLFFPGKYFSFINSATQSANNSMVTGLSLNASTVF